VANLTTAPGVQRFYSATPSTGDKLGFISLDPR